MEFVQYNDYLLRTLGTDGMVLSSRAWVGTVCPAVWGFILNILENIIHVIMRFAKVHCICYFVGLFGFHEAELGTWGKKN